MRMEKAQGILGLGSNYHLYNIGVVTRLTGINIHTLRAWERRYGFPKAERTSGGQRLYSENEIVRLHWVKNLIGQGLHTRQAIAAMRERNDGNRSTLSQSESPLPEQIKAQLAPEELRERLANVLIQHDLERADQLMGEMLAFYKVEDLTLEIIGPVLNAIGEAWEQGHISVATEHLASTYLRQRLLIWMLTGVRPKAIDPIILAGAPGEWHEGSLLMLGVLLRRQGWPVIYLGPAVPFPDLANFIRQTRSLAVVLVALQEQPAQELAKWPHWISQTDGKPIVAFGGRAFIENPDLQKRTAGEYLGATIQDGLVRLIALLNQ